MRLLSACPQRPVSKPATAMTQSRPCQTVTQKPGRTQKKADQSLHQQHGNRVKAAHLLDDITSTQQKALAQEIITLAFAPHPATLRCGPRPAVAGRFEHVGSGGTPRQPVPACTHNDFERLKRARAHASKAQKDKAGCTDPRQSPAANYKQVMTQGAACNYSLQV